VVTRRHSFVTPLVSPQARPTRSAEAPVLLRHPSSFVLLTFFGLFTNVASAPAQNRSPLVLCQSGHYAVGVTPNGGTVTWQTNTSGDTSKFTVTNGSSDCTEGYSFTHTESGPISGVTLDRTSTGIGPGQSVTVKATYSVGAAGVGTLTLKATGQFAGDWNTGDYTVTVVPPSVSVTPDGSAIEAAVGMNKVVAFTVTNTGAASDTYTLTCAVTGNDTCVSVSRASAPINPGQFISDTVTFTPGQAGTSGTVKLRASGLASDSGSYTVSNVAGYAPVVSVQPTNGGTRGVDPFDVVVSHATPSYRSLDAGRAVILSYNASIVKPTPVVQANITNAGLPYPTQYSVSVQWPSNGVRLHLLNGADSVFYTAGTSDTSRLAAAIDAKTNGLTTGAYDVNIVVTAYYATGVRVTTVPTRLLVDDESKSLSGAGWQIAGVERLHWIQGSYSVLVTNGDGSMSFFRRDCSTCPFVSPAGDPSQLTQNASTYQRATADSLIVLFDSTGRMVGVRNGRLNAQVLTLGWSDTLLTSIQDFIGKKFVLGYTGAASQSGKLQTITDPANRVTTVWTDTAGLVYKITDPDNLFTTLGYDASKRLTSVTDRGNATTNLTYDALSFADSAKAPAFTDFTGGSVRPISTARAPARLVWQPTVSGATSGSAKAHVRPDTVFGRFVDPLGNLTQVAYDRFGGPIKTIDAAGLTTTVGRDTLGQALSVTAPNGRLRTFVYSGYLLTRQTDHSTGANVYYDYNSVSMLITIRGDVTRTDIYYRPAYAGGPLNGPVDSIYSGNVSGSYAQDFGGTLFSRHIVNRWGQDSIVIDGQGHQTKAIYADTAQFGGPVQVIDPLGRIVAKYHYDNAGRVDTSWTLANGAYAPTSQTYDPLNQVLTVKNALGHVTQYAYTAQGLSRVVDPKGQVYKFDRNALGLVVAQHDLADTTKADTLKYDKAGRVRTMRTRRGDVIAFSYDSTTGHLLTRSGPDFPADSFRYDPQGAWMVSWNANARDSVAYDNAGRPTFSFESLTGASSYSMSYGYDIQGRVTSRSAPLRGTPVRVSYDPTKGVLTRLCAAAACVTASDFDADKIPHTAAYTDTLSNPAWSRVDTTNSRHVVTGDGFVNNTGTPINLDSAFAKSWDHDTLSRLVSETPFASTGGPWYAYDSAGQLVMACNLSNTRPGFTPVCYDEYNQDHWFGGAPNPYTYDAAWNRTDAAASPAIGPGNRTTTFKGYALTYDLNGDVLSKSGTNATFGTDTSQFTWDALGRLMSVTTWPAGGTHTTVSFAYDPSGRRVSKTVSGVTQWYVHEGDQVTMILDSLGQRLKLEYGWGRSGQNLAFVRSPSWTAAAITQPTVGTLQGLVSPTPGAPIRKQYSATAVRFTSVSPWGETASDTGVVVPIRMGGQEYDQETRLYHLGARYYDPQLGRFLSEDPAGISGALNLYSYAGNNPINGRDPTGLDEDSGCQDEDPYCADGGSGSANFFDLWYAAGEQWMSQNGYGSIQDAFAELDRTGASAAVFDGGGSEVLHYGYYNPAAPGVDPLQGPMFKREWDFTDGRFVGCPHLVIGVLEGTMKPDGQIALGGQPGRIPGWRPVRGFLNVSPAPPDNANMGFIDVAYAGYAEIHTITRPIQFYGGAVTGRANCITGSAHFEGFSPN